MISHSNPYQNLLQSAIKTFISRGLTIGWLPTGFVPISGQQRPGGPGSSALGLRGALRLGRGRGLPRGRRVGPTVHGGRGTGAAVHGLSADPSEGDVPGTGGLGAWGGVLGAWGSWGVVYWSVEVRIGMPAMSWAFRFSFTGIHRGWGWPKQCGIHRYQWTTIILSHFNTFYWLGGGHSTFAVAKPLTVGAIQFVGIETCPPRGPRVARPYSKNRSASCKGLGTVTSAAESHCCASNSSNLRLRRRWIPIISFPLFSLVLVSLILRVCYNVSRWCFFGSSCCLRSRLAMLGHVCQLHYHGGGVVAYQLENGRLARLQFRTGPFLKIGQEVTLSIVDGAAVDILAADPLHGRPRRKRLPCCNPWAPSGCSGRLGASATPLRRSDWNGWTKLKWNCNDYWRRTAMAWMVMGCAAWFVAWLPGCIGR